MSCIGQESERPSREEFLRRVKDKEGWSVC